MIISVWDIEWKKIRSFFNEEEKDLLRKSIVGSTICPPGQVIDLNELDEILKEKIRKLVHPLSNGG